MGDKNDYGVLVGGLRIHQSSTTHLYRYCQHTMQVQSKHGIPYRPVFENWNLSGQCIARVYFDFFVSHFEKAIYI